MKHVGGTKLTSWKAQPNKIRLEAKDEEKYKEKLLNKAKIIADSANRLWREYCNSEPSRIAKRLLTGFHRDRIVARVRRGVKVEEPAKSLYFVGRSFQWPRSSCTTMTAVRAMVDLVSQGRPSRPVIGALGDKHRRR